MRDLKIKKPSKVKEFFAGKGFYFTLAVSLTLIGSAIWFAMNRSIDKFIDEGVNLAKNEMSKQGLQRVNNIVSDVPMDEDQKSKNIKRTIAKETGVKEKIKDKSQAPAEEGNFEFDEEDNKENMVLVPPLTGKVINGFSNDELVKNKTMNDWRVHNGVDIVAPQGAQVKAIADGEVVRVYFDSMMGQCVEIEHQNNLSSVYCGLNKNVNVKEGEIVEAGKIIGAVGDTAIGETALGPHLHLEMFENGSKIDPLLKIKIPQ